MISYRDLDSSVWQQNLCTFCGACAAVCPGKITLERERMVWNVERCITDSGIPCGACYHACARVDPPEISSAFHHPSIGWFSGIYAARGTPEPYTQSGGAATSILTAALSEGLIDGVLTVGVDRLTWEGVPVIAATIEEIRLAAGSRYSHTPVLSTLDRGVKHGFRNLAVVGTPCVISSVRRIMNSELDLLQGYRRCIRFTIGVFCTGVFLPDFIRLKNLGQIRKMEVTGDGLRLIRRDGGIEERPLSAEFMPGCAKCEDFTAECADISAGNIGSPDGYTTLITRTETGSDITAIAIDSGFIKIDREVNVSALHAASTRKKRAEGAGSLNMDLPEEMALDCYMDAEVSG